MPNTIEVRITTTVVAHTSRRVGHVTRPSSLRTSLRNRLARPNHPTTWSGDSFRLSNIAAFTVSLRGHRPRTPASHVIGRPGGTRTPNSRFWRPVLYQLNYWPTNH